MGTYPVIRELHLEVEDEGVRRGCERLVDVIMGDEVVGGSSHGSAGGVGVSRESAGAGVGTTGSQASKGSEEAGRMVTRLDDEEEEEDDDDEDEDDAIVPIF